jgi:GxxExxY protein
VETTFFDNWRQVSADTGRMDEPTPYLDELARITFDAAMAVHRALGPGFLESVYEEALCVELYRRSVPFERQVLFTVQYEGCAVGEGRFDVLIDGSLIVELKAVERLASIHVAQVVSYLRASNRHLGLLINFNVELLRDGIRRVIVSPTKSHVARLGARSVVAVRSPA